MDKGNRGGSARRAASYEKERFANENIKSSLAALLLDKWCWGEIPAALVQAICKAASDDIERAGFGKLKEWQILAQLGSGGLHKNNIHRDLLKKLPKPVVSVPSSFKQTHF